MNVISISEYPAEIDTRTGREPVSVIGAVVDKNLRTGMLVLRRDAEGREWPEVVNEVFRTRVDRTGRRRD